VEETWNPCPQHTLAFITGINALNAVPFSFRAWEYIIRRRRAMRKSIKMRFNNDIVKIIVKIKGNNCVTTQTMIVNMFDKVCNEIKKEEEIN
jgi:hypothetical protein